MKATRIASGLLIVAGALVAGSVARGQTVAPDRPEALPPARDGVIAPPAHAADGVPGVRGVDPHMPVIHPDVPTRTPVIRPAVPATGSEPPTPR